MATRHYITMIDKMTNEKVLRRQLLGNNDFFDDELYEALGIELDTDGNFEETEVDIVQFTYEWHQFLHRHPETLGLPKISKRLKKVFPEDYFRKHLFYFYGTSDSYELQIFEVLKEIANILMNNGVLFSSDEKFLFTLECF